MTRGGFAGQCEDLRVQFAREEDEVCNMQKMVDYRRLSGYPNEKPLAVALEIRRKCAIRGNKAFQGREALSVLWIGVCFYGSLRQRRTCVECFFELPPKKNSRQPCYTLFCRKFALPRRVYSITLFAIVRSVCDNFSLCCNKPRA